MSVRETIGFGPEKCPFAKSVAGIQIKFRARTAWPAPMIIRPGPVVPAGLAIRFKTPGVQTVTGHSTNRHRDCYRSLQHCVTLKFTIAPVR